MKKFWITRNFSLFILGCVRNIWHYDWIVFLLENVGYANLDTNSSMILVFFLRNNSETDWRGIQRLHDKRGCSCGVDKPICKFRWSYCDFLYHETKSSSYFKEKGEGKSFISCLHVRLNNEWRICIWSSWVYSHVDGCLLILLMIC